MAQHSTMLKIIPMICGAESKNLVISEACKTIFDISCVVTHHYTSDANAHITNNEEFTVEKVFDFCLTILQSTDKGIKVVLCFDIIRMLCT